MPGMYTYEVYYDASNFMFNDIIFNVSIRTLASNKVYVICFQKVQWDLFFFLVYKNRQ